MIYFLAINTLYWLILFIIWGRKDVFNLTLKSTMFIMFLVSAWFLATMSGYVIHV